MKSRKETVLHSVSSRFKFLMGVGLYLVDVVELCRIVLVCSRTATSICKREYVCAEVVKARNVIDF